MQPPFMNPPAGVEADSMKNLSAIKTPAEVGVTVIDKNRQWLVEHAAAIDQHGARASARKPYAQRVRHLRHTLAGKPTDIATQADGSV